jgi:hypothetical protein
MLGVKNKYKGGIMGKIDTQKVMWVLDLLTNDESSSDEELADWFVKEGSVDLAFAKELVKYRIFGDLRKDQAMQDFVYDNIDKLED